MKSSGLYRARADLWKLGFCEMKCSGDVYRFVKLQRPPPDIRIFFPAASLRSRMIYRSAAFSRLNGAHQAGRAGSDDNNVSGVRLQERLLVLPFPRTAYKGRSRTMYAAIKTAVTTPKAPGDRRMDSGRERPFR